MIYFECACVLLCVNVDRLKFKLLKKKKKLFKKKLFEVSSDMNLKIVEQDFPRVHVSRLL